MRFRHVIKHYVIQAGDADNHGAAEDWKGKNYSQLDTRLLTEIQFLLSIHELFRISHMYVLLYLYIDK